MLKSMFVFSTEPAYTPIVDRAILPLLSPAFSERKVMKVRLSNGLEAYLISDPNTDMSAIALTVKAGSWEDPVEHPGMAHFLEHMLFLGTKKYPEEGEYGNFVSNNGGMTNAYTTNDHTSYFAAVNNHAFESLVDRFSQFFKEPLFNPSGVARELQAIDQEYAKNIENDDMRILFVQKAIANSKHPDHNFNIGNSDTLSKVSQDELKKWYQEHYSANAMHLIAYSNLPPDKLKDLIVDSFSEIPNKNKTTLEIKTPHFLPEAYGKIVYIEPVKNSRTLLMTWELPKWVNESKDSQPANMICYVLGHEGKESLLAQLKREKLAEGLKCGEEDAGASEHWFVLEIDLTEDGIKQLDDVIERVFQTLAAVKQKGIPSYLFDEMQRMGIINYQYQSREDAFDYVMEMGVRMIDENLETFPEQTFVIQKFDPAAVEELLKNISPNNAFYYLIAPQESTGIKPEHKEKWLGASYAIRTIPQTSLDRWLKATSHSKIGIPVANPFVPKNLAEILQENDLGNNLANKERKIPIPEILIKNESGTIYFSQDDRFFIPQISWRFEIRTPQVEIGNASKVVLADLYVKYVTEALSRVSYNALLAGLSFNIERKENGIGITINGYNENAPLLFEEILKQLKDLSVTEPRFILYKDTLLRQYQNGAKDLPYRQSQEQLKSLIYKNYTTNKQKVLAINKITFEKFKDYANRIFSQPYVEGVMFGNMSKKEAAVIVEKLLNTIKGTMYPKNKLKRPQIIVLPENKGPFFIETSTKVQGNAILLAIQNGTSTFKKRAALEILMQAMKEPFFSTLRTTQQTGYIVKSQFEEVEGELFALFLVQSNTHDMRDLLARFELFIEGFLQEINSNITQEQFESIRAALLENLEQPPKQMSELTEILQKFAFKRDGDFEWRNKQIQGMKDLTYEEFLSYGNDFFGRKNKRRIAVLVKGILPEEKRFQYLPLKSPNELRKLSTFKSM